MNKKQKTCLLVSIAVIVVMGLLRSGLRRANSALSEQRPSCSRWMESPGAGFLFRAKSFQNQPYCLRIPFAFYRHRLPPECPFYFSRLVF